MKKNLDLMVAGLVLVMGLGMIGSVMSDLGTTQTNVYKILAKNVKTTKVLSVASR